MDGSYQNLLDLFVELGGKAENICIRKGKLGRGIFPVDPRRRSKIMTPRNLLVGRNNICISHNEIYIKDSSQFSSREKNFIELNYNYAWRGGGNVGADDFLRYIAAIPESVKKQLLVCKFIDRALLNRPPDDKNVFNRFVDERVVSFEGKRVLASIWDLVNHSSFSPPFRLSSCGVETPPIEPSSEEILHKYSSKNSPVGMWKKYGFTCDCIVAYSVPFNIDVGSHALSIRCAGGLGLGPKEKKSFSIDGDILTIKSLAVGCLSIGLPKNSFKLILSSIGLPGDVADRLFPLILDINLKTRRDLIDSLRRSSSSSSSGTGAEAQLHKALMYEIELIENSLID